MKKRVALISEHASPLALLGGVDSGGQNVYVSQMARHLPYFGYEVDVFTRRDSESVPEVVEWLDGVRIFHVPAGPATFVPKEELMPFMPAFTDYVMQKCIENGYSLTHANFWMSGMVSADIKEALGVPFVAIFHALGRVRRLHQGKADGFPDSRFDVEDRIVREANHLIAECPQEEEDLITLYHADPNKIVLIPGGFDPVEFMPVDKVMARVSLGLPVNRHIILQLGRMVRRKGVATVVRALGRLRQEHGLDAQLVIVGGDTDQPDPITTPEIGRLQAIAAEAGVSDLVTFVGRRGREALKYYYAAADIFVSTPWYEPFGVTPVESMACGTPVVGSAVGGIKFTVSDGETGLLVPPRDHDALADRLAYLLKNPSLLSHFGQAGIRRSNSLFTWQAQAKSLSDLYSGVIGLTGRPATVNPRLVIDQAFASGLDTLLLSRRLLQGDIAAAASVIGERFIQGRKVLVCGNGGSAAEAQHLTAELVGRFKLAGRPSLPAMALTADTAILTALANDVGYDEVFARQVEAFGRPGDILIGISTSGASPNVVRAFEAARERGATTIAMLGRDGGDLAKLADYAMIVPSGDTQRIQEVHVLVLHTLCELIEAYLAEHQNRVRARRVTVAPRVHANGNGNGHANGGPNGKRNGNGKRSPAPMGLGKSKSRGDTGGGRDVYTVEPLPAPTSDQYASTD